MLATREAPQNRKIQKATEREFARRYRVGKQVMESGHAGMAVLFATRRVDSQEVVVKSVRRQTSFRAPAQESEWRRAMEAQMNLPKAATLCELMEVIEIPDTYYVVMERIHGQDLFETLLLENLDKNDVRTVLRQVLEGLAILHGAGRIHKDIKMENIMLSRCASKGSKDVIAKIIDFDTVEEWRPSGHRAHTVVGTDGYIAPEAYFGDYSPASDIFAVGVMMYVLLTGCLPFRKDMFDDGPGENYVGSPAMERIHDRLKSHQINFEICELGECEEAAELCRSLLAFDADSRPSAEKALEHGWFKRLPESPCDQSPSSKHEVTAAKTQKKPQPAEEKSLDIVCIV